MSKTLTKEHLEYLKVRCVAGALARKAGLWSAEASEVTDLLCRNSSTPSGGLVIPYAGEEPLYVRVRLDNPDSARFLVPSRRPVPVYVPRSSVLEHARRQVPLVVTESPTKALTVIGVGYPAVGLGGVSTTLKSGRTELNDSWSAVDLVGTPVVVLFDANRVDNPMVAAAEGRLAVALEKAGADVYVAELPPSDSGEGWGPDDFMYHRGGDALREVIDAAVSAEPVERARTTSADASLDLLSDLPFLLSLETRGAGCRAAVRRILRAHGVRLGQFDEAFREVKLKKKQASRRVQGDGRDGAGAASGREVDKILLATQNHELFHDSTGATFARVEVDGHYEVHALESTSYRRILIRAYHRNWGSAPGREVVGQAVGLRDALAAGDSSEKVVYQRVAPDGAGGVYIDLGGKDWSAIHVSSSGYTRIDAPPVMFRRAAASGVLPEPQPGGSLEDLRPLANLRDEDSWSLFKAWLIMTLSPDGPYPILGLVGEQGSSKSTLVRLIRALVDPRAPALRHLSNNVDDLIIAASHAHLLAFDNVSWVGNDISDALCCLATGSGYGKRGLYTNADEVVFVAKRPVVLNGIADFMVRGDILDRSVQITLPVIPDKERRDEKQLWVEFEELRPRLFGALLERMSGTLRQIPRTRLKEKPRMADFALMAVAAERGAQEPSRFMKAYQAQRAEARHQALEGSPVGAVILEMMQKTPDWEGTSGELLKDLRVVAEDRAKTRYWPQSARTLGNDLRRLAPALRAVGIIYTPPSKGRRKAGGKRFLRLRWQKGKAPSPSSSRPVSPFGRQLASDLAQRTRRTESGARGKERRKKAKSNRKGGRR